MASASEMEKRKLGAELLKAKETVANLKRELELKEGILIEIEEERDRLLEESKNNKRNLFKMDEIVKNKEEQARKEERAKVESSLDDLKSCKKELTTKEAMIKHLEELCNGKDDEIQFYKQKLRETTADYKMADAMKDIKDYREEKIKFHKENQKLVKDFNVLSGQVEDLIAENRVLREMAKVPENYGIDIQKIKLAQAEKVEDLKARIRYLEKEVEGLEAERAQLKYLQRNVGSQILGGAGDKIKGLDPKQLEAVEEFAMNLKAGKIVLPLTDKSKELERERDRLLARIEFLENNYYGNMEEFWKKHISKIGDKLHGGPEGPSGQIDHSVLDTIKKQNEDLLQQFRTMMSNVSAVPRQDSQNLVSPMPMGPAGMMFFPPTPEAGNFGNWNDIRGGYSYKFKTRVNFEGELMEDIEGYDKISGKYETASLQLQNIECLELLDRKEEELKALRIELEDIRHSMRKNLLLQDQLFRQAYDDRKTSEKEIKELKQKLTEARTLADENGVRVRHLEETSKALKDSDPDSRLLQTKFSDLSRKLALQDVNLLRLSRKCDSYEEEYNRLKEIHKDLEVSSAERETYLIEKLNKLVEWKTEAIEQMKLMFKQLENSVPLEDHRMKVNEVITLNEKIADFTKREASHLKEMAIKEANERELYQQIEKTRELQEENTELLLEMEVIKTRLDVVDPEYHKFQEIFKMIVDTMKSKNISPTQMFAQFDMDRSGDISKAEFHKVLDYLGLRMGQDDVETLFLFIDLDGTNKIEYKEFVRRLRRSGVRVKRAEEEALIAVYQAITGANLTLHDAFRIFDRGGNHQISKKDIMDTFKDMKINISPDAVEKIFAIADISGDGLISAEEFYRLFNDIIKELAKQDSEEEFSLNWKYGIMLTLDKAIKSENITLREAFAMIDEDGSQSITFEELKKMFHEMKIILKDGELANLFNALDKDQSGTISFSELLSFLNEALHENERIQRLQMVQQRAKELQKNELFRHGHGPHVDKAMKVVSETTSLQMKITILEAREQSAKQRSDALNVKLKGVEAELKEYVKMAKQNEESHTKLVEELFLLREKHQKDKILLGQCVSKEASQLHTLTIEKLRIDVNSARAALETYKKMYESAAYQAKVLKLSLEKTRGETETLENAIKEYQSQSDEKMLIGKLHHTVLFFKWNEALLKRNYDKALESEQSSKMKLVENENKLVVREKEILDVSRTFVARVRELERTVSELSVKIMPTLTMTKIEEQGKKIREFANMKSELEMFNKVLRDKNYELQLMCDFHDSQKLQLEELDKRIKRSAADDLTRQLIEVSAKVSHHKLEELKAKREAQMSKEREAYYMRVSKQQTESLRKLEEQCASADLKMAEREDFWRNRYTETLKLLNVTAEQKDREEDILSRGKTINDVEMLGSTLRGGKEATRVPQIKGFGKLSSGDHGDQPSEELKSKYRDAADELARRGDEIEALKQKIKDLSSANHGFDKDLLAKLGGMAQDEEVRKLAYTAQQTIQTMRQMLNDKNDQLERKEKEMMDLRDTAMNQKRADTLELARLQELLKKYQNDVVVDLERAMNEDPLHVSKVNSQVMARMKIGDIESLIDDKEKRIMQLTAVIKSDEAVRAKNETRIKDLIEQVETLRADLAYEKDRQDIKKLQKEKESLTALVNTRNQDLVACKKAMQKLFEDLKKANELRDVKDDDVKEKIMAEKKNTSDLETQLELMKKRLKDLTTQLQKAASEMKELQGKEIETREKCTKLIQEKKDIETKYDKLREELIAEKKKAPVAKKEESKEKTVGGDLEAKTKEVEQLRKELITLKREKNEDIFDAAGELKPENFRFEKADEFYGKVRLWLQRNPWLNLMATFKDLKKKKTQPTGDKRAESAATASRMNGYLSPEEFLKLLNDNGVKVRDRDQQFVFGLLEKDRAGNVDFFQFYRAVRGLVDKDTQAAAKIEASKEAAPRTIQSGKEHTMGLRGVSGAKVAEGPDAKKFALLKEELVEIKKERNELDKQLVEWKAKAKKMEKELEGYRGKPFNPDMTGTRDNAATGTGWLSPPPPTTHGGRDRTIDFDETQRLRGEMDKLETEYYKLKRFLEVDKESEVKHLKETNYKMEVEIKSLKNDNLKMTSTLEKFAKGPASIRTEDLDVEKDKIIRNLKEKLETLREDHSDMTGRVHTMDKENRDLRFQKDNLEIKLERLNRRINELEQFHG